MPTFDPEFTGRSSISATGDLPPVGRILGIGTVARILTLHHPAVEPSPRGCRAVVRFSGSRFAPRLCHRASVPPPRASAGLVKAARIATYGHSTPATDFSTMRMAELLSVEWRCCLDRRLHQLMSGQPVPVLVGRNVHWGVAWHRFSAFFNIYYFKRLKTRRGALARPSR